MIEAVTFAFLCFILVMILFVNWNVLSIKAKLKPPRMIVPDDLDTKELRPGPIVRLPAPPTYERGDRVRIKETAGFSRGATGVVKFQEPTGERCWVIRHGADSPAWFWNRELEALDG